MTGRKQGPSKPLFLGAKHFALWSPQPCFPSVPASTYPESQQGSRMLTPTLACSWLAQSVSAALIYMLRWDCENTSEWQEMNGCIVPLSSSPSHLHHILLSLSQAGWPTQRQECMAWQASRVCSWCSSFGSSGSLWVQTSVLFLTSTEPLGIHSTPDLLYMFFYFLAVQDVSLIFLPTSSHTLEVSNGFDNRIIVWNLG